ncbi:MAG: DUF1428 domain-containing protein [Burkholderiaceae bacterium]|nr:DUF1428 domain-containing protein [Burkholderiaceae bacterium]
MAYVDGFVTAVPTAHRELYKTRAAAAAAILSSKMVGARGQVGSARRRQPALTASSPR